MSELQIFWKIAVPNAAPGIIAGTILTFARALGEYGATSMLAGNIPGKTSTISQKIAMVIQDGDYLTAGVWVIIILAIAFCIIVAMNLVAGKKYEEYAELVGYSREFDLNIEEKRIANVRFTQYVCGKRNIMAIEVAIKKKIGNFCLDVAFSAGEEMFALLGASGCGKSMTLKCIAGIETPDEGKIILNGRTLFDSEKKINLIPQKRKVGYMFQDYAPVS